MKQFIDKLIERLKTNSVFGKYDNDYMESVFLHQAIEIVNQLAEEYINCSSDTSTDCSNCLSTEYIQDKLQEQYRNGYAEGWHDCASTIQQSAPYQPKGET